MDLSCHQGRSFLLATIAACGSCLALTDAFAATELSLSAPDGHQGTAIDASLKILTDVAVAGFNAEIILPAGITVTGVNKGALLVSSGLFNFDYHLEGQSLRVMGYSVSDSITGFGELVRISIHLDQGLLGIHELRFAATNPTPLINSMHAVSNVDGTESLSHTFAVHDFLVFSDTSDYDDDGMPDWWEVEFGLDPRIDNADADSDEDGYSDYDEYVAGSDPSDPASTPDSDVIFRDSFEDPM